MQKNSNLMWDIDIEGISFKMSGLAEYVSQISFSSSKNMMTTFDIYLKNRLVNGGNEDTSKIFARGRMLSLYCGWGELKYMGSALVERYSLDVQGEMLNIVCMDKGKEMAREEKDKTYPNTTDYDIVLMKALEYGLYPCITKTNTKVSRVQHNLTDYRFIASLAKLNNFAFFVIFNPTLKRWELHFEPPQNIIQKEIYKYTYSGDNSLVLSFNPQVSGSVYRDTTITLKAHIVNTEKSEILKKEPDTKKLETLTVGVAGRKANELIEMRFNSKEEAEAFLKNYVKEREEAYMTATAEVVGNTDLKCMDYVYFGGLSFMFFPTIDGYWRMDTVDHKIAPSASIFTTSLSLVRVKQGSFSPNFTISKSIDGDDEQPDSWET